MCYSFPNITSDIAQVKGEAIVIPKELTMRFIEGGLNVNLKTFSSFEQFIKLCVQEEQVCELL